jgi:hypothetical protein
MKKLVLFLTGLAATYAQDTLYAHVDFIKPTSGKAADYHKGLMSAVVPKIQKAVDAGEAYALLNCGRRFPHGSGLDATEVRIAWGKTLKSVGGAVTNDTGMPPGLFATVSGELWTTVYTQDLDKLFQAKHYRVLFLKTLPGKTARDVADVYKSIPVPTKNGVVIFSRTFRGPGEEANVVVMHGYTDLDQVPPPGAVDRQTLDRLSTVRTALRTELWDRRPELVAPK